MIIWHLILWFISLPLVRCAGFYGRDPHIIELNPGNFDKVVHRTNYTTLVEFYAPWCGYCQQLKSIYRSGAKKLDGLVQVAAVNCDEEANKPLCARYKIEGFPSIVVFKPPKIDISKPPEKRTKFLQHASEFYAGQRKLAPIVEYALSRIKNYVTKINNSKRIQDYLASKLSPETTSRPAAILFSKRETTSSIFKSLALDWLGLIDFYQVFNSKLSSDLDELHKLAENCPNISQYLQTLLQKQRNSSKSKLVVFDVSQDQYFPYDGPSLTKEAISSFVSKKFNLAPKEGPGSKRQAFLNKLANKKPKSTTQHDEL